MDITTQFQTIAGELVAVQRELSQLYELATDPVAEARDAARRADVLGRRDALLWQWGRLGLSWMLSGGDVQLGNAPAGWPTEPATPRVVAAAPATAYTEPAPLKLPAERIVERVAIDRVATEPTQEHRSPVSSAFVVHEPEDRGPVDVSGLERGIGPQWVRAVQTRPATLDPDRLREILRQLGEPPAVIDDAQGVTDELRRLAEFTAPAWLSGWLDLPKDLQRALVGMSVARARRVQDEVAAEFHPTTIEAELDRFFSGMTAFSKREQPGFVFGLRRHHHSVAETWGEDARRWWAELASRLPEPLVLNPERALEDLRKVIDDEGGDEEIVNAALRALDATVSPDDTRLVRLMMPHQEKLRKHTRFKRLRKAIRDMMTEDEAIDAEVAQDAGAVPADWAWWPRVRGHHAMLVGGDLREDARRRIQETFDFSSLEWVTTDHSRNVQNLANAVRSGSVDFVIILRRFIGHNVDRTVIPACRTAGVPWVSVERGYGVSQMRMAIERFLAEEEEE